MTKRTAYKRFFLYQVICKLGSVLADHLSSLDVAIEIKRLFDKLQTGRLNRSLPPCSR